MDKFEAISVLVKTDKLNGGMGISKIEFEDGSVADFEESTLYVKEGKFKWVADDKGNVTDFVEVDDGDNR